MADSPREERPIQMEHLEEVREIRRLLESPRPIRVELTGRAMLRLAVFIAVMNVLGLLLTLLLIVS